MVLKKGTPGGPRYPTCIILFEIMLHLTGLFVHDFPLCFRRVSHRFNVICVMICVGLILVRKILIL